MKEIKSSDVLVALKPQIEKIQLETSHRLHSEIYSIFAYAIVHSHNGDDIERAVVKAMANQNSQVGI